MGHDGHMLRRAERFDQISTGYVCVPQSIPGATEFGLQAYYTLWSFSEPLTVLAIFS